MTQGTIRKLLTLVLSLVTAVALAQPASVAADPADTTATGSASFSSTAPAETFWGTNGWDGRQANSGSNPAYGVAYIWHNNGVCTGFLVARNRIATAGHCLTTGAHGNARVRSAKSFYVRVGSTWAVGRSVWVHPNFVRYGIDRAPGYDYGVIVLDRNMSSSRVLSMRATVSTRVSLQGRNIAHYGYPDSTIPISQSPGSTLWRTNGRVSYNRPLYLNYTNDTWPGMSGGPVITYDSNKPCGKAYCVVAINSNNNGSVSSNEGVRITPKVKENLLSRG